MKDILKKIPITTKIWLVAFFATFLFTATLNHLYPFTDKNIKLEKINEVDYL